MDRIAHFDVSRRFEKPAHKAVAQVSFGFACVVAMVVIRGLLDTVASYAGPFALVYPTVVLATLYGHWRAGLTAYVLAFVWAWYVVLPAQWSFEFVQSSDAARTAVNAVAVLVVLVVPEGFRKAVETYREESQRALDRRLVLLAELEHRTKNNFALVASLLETQKRQVAAPEAGKALEDAIARVRTFANVYSNLAIEQSEGAEVAMRPYLEQLIGRVSRGSFPPNVRVGAKISEMTLSRETGVAIGLFVNEVLLNCAKYAFGEATGGSVSIVFETTDEGWRLAIEDDGGNTPSDPEESGGLGSRLMSAFAQQANAIHTVRPGPMGYAVELRSV